jgi:ABC-2 type transport system permease protein
MLGHLIRKEILDHLSSLRFLILAAIGALAIWLSLYDGYAYYQARLKDHRLAQAMTQERLRQLQTSGWEDLQYFGFEEHKPPSPMSIFVRGLEPALGRSISNSDVTARRPRWSPAEAEPILGMFPPLDLGLVVQVVISLFVLLLFYDAVCGEKEGGTLRLTASFPVPRHWLLVGKFIGILVPALGAFGLPLLLGIAVITSMPDVRFTGLEWTRLVLTVSVFILYLSAFTCAGLLASCLTHRPATSFVFLMTFWVATAVVVPRLGLIAAEAFRPIPNARELQDQMRAISASIRASTDTNIKSLPQWEKENPRWRDTPEGREARQIHYWKSQEQGRAISRLWQRRYEELMRPYYDARLNLALTLARLSPAFAFHNAVTRLAGAGIDRHQRFETAFTKDYMKLYSDWYFTFLHLNLFRENHPDKYGEYKWDISDMPRFNYREAWPEVELHATFVDLGLLALWGLAFFAGAYVMMLRYDLR